MTKHRWIYGKGALFLVRPDCRVVIEVTKLVGNFDGAGCYAVRSLLGERFEQHLMFGFDAAILDAERMANLTEPADHQPLPGAIGGDV